MRELIVGAEVARAQTGVSVPLEAKTEERQQPLKKRGAPSLVW